MTITDWIPAASTAGLVATVAWLSRGLIMTRLSNSVSHEFDRKLELLKGEVRTNEAHVNALRSGALSSSAARSGVQYSKQLDAVDALWAGVLQLRKARGLLTTMQVMNLNEVMASAPNDQKIREFVGLVGGEVKITDLDLVRTNEKRPYLPPLAWAYFSAYSTLIASFIMLRDMIVMGIEDPHRFFSKDATPSLVKKILPHHAQNIDTYGQSYLAGLADEIENLVLTEIQKVIAGDGFDEASITQAKQILELSSKANEELAEAQQARSA